MLRPVNVTTGEHIETWAHIQTTFTIHFVILRIYRSSSSVLHLFVDNQTLANALTWRRSGAKSILEPVTTRNYDASRSLQATFSDDSSWVQQVTIMHPLYYIDQRHQRQENDTSFSMINFFISLLNIANSRCNPFDSRNNYWFLPQGIS